MKLDSSANAHSATTSATLFSEQVSKVCDLFQDWNDCERSVSLFAVLKRIPFSCTKFLQSVIDTNLSQAYCLEHTKLLEHNANSAIFIHSLHEAYSSLGPRDSITAAASSQSSQSLSSATTTATKRDSLIFGEAAAHANNARRASLQPPPTHRRANKAEPPGGGHKCYERKEDILGEVLTLMPILTPGNEEAKCAYLEFIPMTVEDAIRGAVNTSLVQQIFSYLLIHPAFSTDDRRSLSKFLRHLEEHIVNTDPNFILYPNGASPTSEGTNCSQTPSSAGNSSSMHPPHNNWQAIAPPTSKSTDTIVSSWDSQHHLTPNNGPKSSSNPSINGTPSNVTQLVANPYADDVPDYRCNNAMLDLRQPSVSGIPPKLGHLYEANPEDHHISFSKNGTEIDDDCEDTDKSNTQIGFDTLANLNEFLTVPGVIDNITLKTRRSNSLTTTGSINIAGTASAQNLSHLMQKPRSFSLSMVSPRSSLTSSGSDTRLDDFKPNNYAKQPTQHNVGMSNIGQWLKSLRLHKYVWLFSNITYEQMLGISEEYLQNLNVTKGARHKLVVCIQRLKDRHTVLCKLEKELMQSQTTIGCAIDELTAVVLTPMKPVEPMNKLDVGAQFLRLLNLVSSMVEAKHIAPQDEEMINSMMWILEKAVHNEAFVAHTNQLKEHRFKVSRIKAQFPAKTHFVAGSKPSCGTTVSGLPNVGASPSTASVVAGSSGPPVAAMEACAISRSSIQESSLTDEFTRPVESSTDSDYQSMSSSQSNSVESLDNLVERAMSNPNSLTAQLDFSKLLPIHYAKQERRGSAGNFSQLLENDIRDSPSLPRLYQRRNSFLTDHSIRNSKALYIDASDSDDYMDKYNDHGFTAFSKGPKAVLVRPANIGHFLEVPAIPKPFSPLGVPNMMHLPPPTPAYPVFDSTKPPPVLVHRGMSFESPRYTVLTRSKHTPVKPVDTPKEVIEYYRPKEMRVPITQAPSTGITDKHTPTKSEPIFHLKQPSINITNNIGHIFESKPELIRTSKIAANFSEPPRTPPSAVKTNPKEQFPALLPQPIPQRYIVPPKPATSLASIVRMAPQAPPQQRMILTKSEATKPSTSSATSTGMQNVNSWLKSLRLHKYQWLFASMTYEQMLNVNEGYLESLNITKGARNKLVLSIQKLNDRIEGLEKVEKGLIAGDMLLSDAVDEMILVAQTPMLPALATDPKNVASKLVNLLTMVFDKIIRLSNGRLDDQTINNKLAFALDLAAHSEGCSTHQTQLRKMRNRFGSEKKFPR